jgi:hypothetical protein
MERQANKQTGIYATTAAMATATAAATDDETSRVEIL